MSNPALTKEAAAAYVGLSVSAFDEIVRPFVPFVSLDTPNAKRPPVMVREQEPMVEIIREHYRARNALPAAPLFRLTGHRSALQRLQDTATAIGLPKMRLHDWRHVFAVQAVRDGLPYHIIAHQLGHSNTIMVQKVYGRFAVTLDDLRAVKQSRNTNPVTLRLVTEG